MRLIINAWTRKLKKAFITLAEDLKKDGHEMQELILT